LAQPTKRSVEFQSEGTTVRGDFYTPRDAAEPAPVIVMAGGWCYVKELIMPDYAQYFVDAGLAVLIFDYRNLGASDGEPRQHLDPWAQIEDYRNAISFVSTLPEVDAERIGVWGISYSGGHVLIVGATDPRVKCVASNIPVVDGYYTVRRNHGGVGYRKLLATLSEDREKRFHSGVHGYIAMSAHPEEELSSWPFPEIKPVFMKLKAQGAERHEHRNTIASVEKLMEYTVFPYLPRLLNTPTLVVVADGDDITAWEKEIPVYNQIPTTKKRLFLVGDTSHMTMYSDKSRLELAAEAARDWFLEWLPSPT
jgi:cephalosporin-C deacetylase-like acetyl esterase